MLVAPPMFGGRGTSLINELRNVGLTDGLKLCLDAGDINSYDGTSQTWKDLSGNGSDFYRGSGSGTDGADPTFNGKAGGLSANEYFSFDGGDYFTAVNTNPQWLKDIFRVGSAAVFAMVRLPSDTNTYLLATEDGTGSHYGGSFKYSADAGIKAAGLVFMNASAGGPSLLYAGGVASFSFPGNYGIGVSTVIASNGDWQVSGSLNANSAPLDAPSPGTIPATNDPTNTKARIMANGNVSQIAPNGARLYGLAVWQGISVAPDRLAYLYTFMKNRFGL